MQECHNLEAILAEGQGRPVDHASLLISSHEKLGCDAGRSLQDFFRRLFDAVCKHTATFRSVPLSQVDTNGKTLRQSPSSIISSLYQGL